MVWIFLGFVASIYIMYLLMQARPAAARPMNTGSDDENNENRGGWTGSGSSSKSTTKAPSNIDACIFLRCNGTLIYFVCTFSIRILRGNDQADHGRSSLFFNTSRTKNPVLS